MQNINTSNLDIDTLLPKTDTTDNQKSNKTAREKQTKKQEAIEENQIMKAVKRTTKNESKTAENDDAAEKQALVLKIHRYLIDDRFGPYLKELGFSHTTASLNKKDISSLTAELDKIKVCVSSKNGNQMISGAVLGAIKGSEVVLSKYYDIRGLSASLQQDDHFLDTLREVELEHQSFAYVNPKIRLAGIVGVKAIGVNQLHQMMKKTTTEQKQKIYDELVTKKEEDKVDDSKDSKGPTGLAAEFVGLGTLQPTIPISKVNDTEEVKDSVEPVKELVKQVKSKPKGKKVALRKEPNKSTVNKIQKSKPVKQPKQKHSANEQSVSQDSRLDNLDNLDDSTLTISHYTAEQMASLSGEALKANQEFAQQMCDIQLPDSFFRQR